MANNGGAGHMRTTTSGNIVNVKNEAIASPAANQWPMGATPDTASSDYSATVSQPTPANVAPSSGSSQPQPQMQQSSQQHAVDKRRLANLINEVDPYQQVDEDAETCLLDIADDFIDTVLAASCQVAKNRKSSVLEVKDVQYVLDTQYNLWTPGFGAISDTKQAYKRPAPAESHKQRMAIIRKLFKTH